MDQALSIVFSSSVVLLCCSSRYSVQEGTITSARWTIKIFMQSPAECAIPQVNQANFPQGLEQLFPVGAINFKIDMDRNRPVMRSRDVN